MKVTLTNDSPHELQLWWLDGTRGVDKGTIQPGGQYKLQTYISHSFFARPSFVGGNTLTNESGLLWYGHVSYVCHVCVRYFRARQAFPIRPRSRY